MKKELKDAIIAKVQSNADHFQLTHFIVSEFREYIYNKDGEYLIGGKEVAEFIHSFIRVYIIN